MGDNIYEETERLHTLELEIAELRDIIANLRAALVEADRRAPIKRGGLPPHFISWCIVGAIALLPLCCYAADKAPKRQDGDRTTTRDSNGRIVGTSTTSGDKTTYRGYNGQVVYTSTERGDKTYYRDYNGRSTGTTVTTNNTTQKTSSSNSNKPRSGR